MYIEAIFSNIANRILKEIESAEQSVYIAVAWFTNKLIFDKLLLKVKNGCKVYIIISNDKINENSQIDFELLEKFNGKIYKIGDGDTNLMHNKFCVIDHTTVITGSYNWSYKAESNHENIVINSNNTTLAEQFIKEFHCIVKKQFPNQTIEDFDFPLDKIIKRLEVLKNLIILEDIDDLELITKKLFIYKFNEDINSIVSFIQGKQYGKAITAIQLFISNYQQLSIWNDPEIAGIKLEIKILESQINAFDNEKIELEKVLSDFQHRHTLELGEIILEILKLRKIKFKNQPREKESEEDFNNYQEQFDIEKQKKQFELTNEEKLNLKKKFRKATTFCHPDKVNDEQKEEAERIFINLKKAYDEHDIDTVNQILKDLESGKLFQSNADTISEKEKLKTILEQLKANLKRIEKEIIELKNNETFEVINSITNWDNYFTATKEQLKEELNNLTLEIQP